jgi:hypothetical protein
MPTLNVNRPEYWALAIGIVLAVANIMSWSGLPTLEAWKFNCRPGYPCQSVFIRWLLPQLFAVIGALSSFGFLASQRVLYPPDPTNPIPHLASYVVISVSLVILLLFWPGLTSFVLFFIALPLTVRWIYKHDPVAAVDREEEAYRRCLALRDQIKIPTPEQMTVDFERSYSSQWGKAPTQTIRNVALRIASNELPRAEA